MRAAVRTVALAGALGLVAALARGPAVAYEAASVRDGGSLTGVVRFAGKPLPAALFPVSRDRGVCGEDAATEALVVARHGGVRGAVVMVDGVTRGKKGSGEIVLDSRGCVFGPHVAAVMTGTRARVKNSDPVVHNPHGWLGKTPVFNVALPAREQTVDITRRLTRSGMVRVLCDVHPHMGAWLVVHDSPYVTVTGEDGAFRIDDVPPGTHTITLWHEGFRLRGRDREGRPTYDAPRSVRREVTIGAGATVALDFVIR